MIARIRVTPKAAPSSTEQLCQKHFAQRFSDALWDKVVNARENAYGLYWLEPLTAEESKQCAGCLREVKP